RTQRQPRSSRQPARRSTSTRRTARSISSGRDRPGPQPPLIDRELFEAVQRRLTEQRTHHVTTRTKSDAPLKGILFDAAGDPMVPTHATKQGVRYRYYVSQPICAGLPCRRSERLFAFRLRTLKRSLPRRSRSI